LNTKAKGSRGERRARRVLEAAGYRCTRAAASLGLFDVIAIGPLDVRLLQVKTGTATLSLGEREQLELFHVPANVTKEYWRFRDRARAPLIEVIR
jgi:hypothetical protein